MVKTGRPTDRPNPQDAGIIDKLCEELVAGKSMTVACRPKDMPSEAAVYRAMAKDEEFARIIARAREAQQEAEIERIIELADQATTEDWQVRKLQIWARQWRVGKLAPKKYGEKITQEVTGKDGAALIPVINLSGKPQSDPE